MVKAKCVRFVEERGFGFVRPLDGGADAFVHATVIPGGDPLAVGEVVAVEIADSPRGPRAVRLERVG